MDRPAAQAPDDRILLFAYDGSTGADVAVDAGAGMFPGRRAVVLTVWRSALDAAPALLSGFEEGLVRDTLLELDGAAEKRALALAERGAQRATALGVRAEPRAEALRTNVWTTIEQVADQLDAAAIVVGSRGRSELASVVLGSVSQGLVHHSRRPVVVAPVPPGS